MQPHDLEQLDLNTNEAKVYYALLLRGQATAKQLITDLGVHRNIVYDNLSKLIDKGLASFVSEGRQKTYYAEDASNVVEYLEDKKRAVQEEVERAKQLLPDINEILASNDTHQEVSVYRGKRGLKQVLAEIVQAEESWCIGVTNESVNILGETYWKNYNAKKKARDTKEWLLWNSDFADTVMKDNPKSHHRILPEQLDQVTETIIYSDKVGIFVFSATPLVIVIENTEISKMFRNHFDVLWDLSKKK